MSKARSPREVCSTTMGTNGLMGYSLLPGVQSFGACAGCSFSGVQQLARAQLDEWAGRDEVGGANELVDSGCAEEPLELLVDLRPEPLLDLAAQLAERVELGRVLRELVVERRQYALLQLLEHDGR